MEVALFNKHNTYISNIYAELRDKRRGATQHHDKCGNFNK